MSVNRMSNNQKYPLVNSKVNSKIKLQKPKNDLHKSKDRSHGPTKIPKVFTADAAPEQQEPFDARQQNLIVEGNPDDSER